MALSERRKSRPFAQLKFRFHMVTDDLLRHLRELEVKLHQPEIRRDPSRLDELLHESFIEFGRVASKLVEGQWK
jgi:hypothetical protein